MRLSLVLIFAVVMFANNAHAENAAAEKTWFVGVADKAKGPLTAAAVEKLIAKGDLNGDTLAWQDGMPEWCPLSEVPRFRALVATPPPLPKLAQPPPLPQRKVTPSSVSTSASAAPQKAKPPPMPSMPAIVTTPPPLSATPPQSLPRRVIGASRGVASSATRAPPLPKERRESRTLELVIAAPADARAWAEERLAECKLRTDVVGVIRVLRGVVSASTTPENACASRVLASALTNVGVNDEEPFEIIVAAAK